MTGYFLCRCRNLWN